jgi:hypothetical protein
MGTGVPNPPSWENIQHLIDRVDQVCRDSELVRAHAELTLRRRLLWPDWRQLPLSTTVRRMRPTANPR